MLEGFELSTINLHNCDCMDFMREVPDKAYDLAIVDPPYGIGGDNYGFGGKKAFLRTANRLKKKWDSKRPTQKYFKELQRVSKQQIIWGGNHFADLLPPSPSYVFWDKHITEGVSLSDGELAWCSIGGRIKIYRQQWCGYLREGEREKGKRIHPSQKPVALYKWLLKNYAKPGDKILETHGGSMSIAIACYDMGFDLDLCELDEDYFKAGKARVERHMAQTRLFEPTT